MNGLDPRPLGSGDRDRLLELVLSAPGYYRTVHGREPGRVDADEILEALPAGRRPEHKQVLGLFLGEALAGVAELIQGYPDASTAYLGLLLLAEAHQGKGLGPQALDLVYAQADTWGCQRVRLAVIATNAGAHRFWMRMGFEEVTRKPMPGCTGEAIVMERALCGAAPGNQEVRYECP